MSKDGIKNSRLGDQINNFISLNIGIIEIYAKVVDKMPNGISYSQAKSLIKSLIIIGWPEKLVNKFIKICSGEKSTDHYKKNLLKDIITMYKAKKIIYMDDDIKKIIDHENIEDFWLPDNNEVEVKVSDDSDNN